MRKRVLRTTIRPGEESSQSSGGSDQKKVLLDGGEKGKKRPLPAGDGKEEDDKPCPQFTTGGPSKKSVLPRARGVG